MLDNCPACKALKKEAGDHAKLYAKKLLIRGWAGAMSKVERAYMNVHPPAWWLAAQERGRALHRPEQTP